MFRPKTHAEHHRDVLCTNERDSSGLNRKQALFSLQHPSQGHATAFLEGEFSLMIKRGYFCYLLPSPSPPNLVNIHLEYIY